MSTALLLNDPQPETRGFLARHLAADGFEVLDADDPAAVEGAALALVGDAATLDRWEPYCPVIVIGSPDDDEVDRLRAFQRGCDDYVMRPFLYDELVARIRAVLRRATPPPPPERIVVGELVVDRATRRVSVAGRTTLLAGKEFELLVQLASDPQRVFTKEQLLRDVWGFRTRCRTRTLDSHASRLRRKLAAAGGIGYVINVWGVGYKLVDC
jgi:DNA-binding response OmpR family regulator